MEDTQTFQEALYAILLPLQGHMRDCLPGSHALLWSSVFLLKTMCSCTHPWDLPVHTLMRHAFVETSQSFHSRGDRGRSHCHTLDELITLSQAL